MKEVTANNQHVAGDGQLHPRLWGDERAVVANAHINKSSRLLGLAGEVAGDHIELGHTSRIPPSVLVTPARKLHLL